MLTNVGGSTGKGPSLKSTDGQITISPHCDSSHLEKQNNSNNSGQECQAIL